MTNSTTAKALASMGSALVATRAARAVGGFDSDSILGWLGLTRRQSRFWSNVALVGAGAAMGALGALLLAPSSGREMRKRIGDEAARMRMEAGEKLLVAQEVLLEEVSQPEPVRNADGLGRPVALS